MKTLVHQFPLNRLIAMLLSAILLSWTGIVNAAEFDRTYAGYEALLKRYVADGRVDYKALKTDTTALDLYLDSAAGVAEAHFNAWTEPERLAFLINLYNAATLKLIIDHYPVKSIKDIGSFFKGPWDQPVVRLFGKTITLDNLEHDIIRKDYSEPRIHLALVCAAKGCPPLRSEAYTAEKLDAQLDDQSRRFLESPAGLRIDRGGKVVYFSSIFKWYGKDFVDRFLPASGFSGLDKTERAVANFSSGYLSAADGDYLKSGGYSVKYLDYDWSLNEK
ncbi:MAG: DUF547 domain-containing protein [Deltaproteobacteria bacterium]|nr:DUF547 domain-containing protein [Deltaproteobacteria bacterium]